MNDIKALDEERQRADEARSQAAAIVDWRKRTMKLNITTCTGLAGKDRGHPEIIYDKGEECPLCAVKAELETVVDQREALVDEIKELQTQYDNLLTEHKACPFCEHEGDKP